MDRETGFDFVGFGAFVNFFGFYSEDLGVLVFLLVFSCVYIGFLFFKIDLDSIGVIRLWGFRLRSLVQISFSVKVLVERGVYGFLYVIYGRGRDAGVQSCFISCKVEWEERCRGFCFRGGIFQFFLSYWDLRFNKL